MNVEGKWYMQPGDMPADFVFPLVLQPDGRAEWTGEKTLVQRYGVWNGKLSIGEGPHRMVFKLPEGDEDPQMLSGQILTEYEPNPENDEFGPPILTDAAVLLRDPGALKQVDYAREDVVSSEDGQPGLF